MGALWWAGAISVPCASCSDTHTGTSLHGVAPVASNASSPTQVKHASLPLSSWLRDTTLVPITSTAALGPAHSPIDLRLAPTTAASVTATGVAGAAASAALPSGTATVGGLAAMTSADRVPLGVSVSTLAGQSLLPTSGQVIY